MGFSKKNILYPHDVKQDKRYIVLGKSVFMIAIFAGAVIGWKSILTQAASSITKTTARIWIKAVSQLWSPLIQDEQWNVNVMLVWVWWKWHRWAYNADTILVASYSTKTNTLQMASLPRDLYIKVWKTYYWRINSKVEYWIWQWLWLTGWLTELKQTVWEILWVKVPYYALVDFKWFERMIDHLGWIQITVPEKLVDTSFPTDEFNYWTLIVESWTQLMNWETALNYARSRHSTSDFDRSNRQQLVIRAIVNQVIKWWMISNIKWLYDEFNKTVVTNITYPEILNWSQYATNIKESRNYVIQSDCFSAIKLMQPGCLLYSPPRDLFGWAAVIIPYGATPSKVSNYERTSLFGFINLVNHEMALESQKIVVLNWVDVDSLTGWKSAAFWISNDAWLVLKRFWFDIIDIWNSEYKTQQTMAFAIWTGSSKATVDSMNLFFPVQNGTMPEYSQFSWYVASWATMVVILGNDFIPVRKKAKRRIFTQ